MNSCCEFSKKIFINQIQKKEFRITIEADKSERKALAERFSIPEILSLSCFYKLAYFHGGHIRAQGMLKSSIIQNCVVSLEDFPVDIEDGFELIFIPLSQVSSELEELDDPDIIPYDNDYIDIGEVTAQQLALLLDPYPHKPNVERKLIIKEKDLEIQGIKRKKDSPFKILEKLKKG